MTFETLFVLGVVALLSGAAATVFCYFRLRRVRTPERRPSFFRYFLFAVVAGFAAYIAGTAVGIYVGCLSPDAGNLCGIWGALGVGPLVAGIVLWAYGPIWLRRTGKTEST